MSATLTIERLSVDCRVPEPVADDRRRAHDVLDTVLASARQELPDRLGRILAAEPGGDAIAFIDTLRFDVTIDAAWPRERIAAMLAQRLSENLRQTLEHPATVRFRDRAEMVARFIVDLAQGMAFTRGWHTAFAGLKLLPVSAILRTLIVDEPSLATTALARLAPADLAKAISLLSRTDAARALAAVCGAAPPEGACDPRAIATALLAQNCLPLATPQQQLALLIALGRDGGTRADAAALALARVLVGMVFADGAEPTELDCIDRLAAALRADADAAGQAVVALLSGGLDALDRSAVVHAVRALRREASVEVDEQSSRCGGAWLLLPGVLAALRTHRHAPALALAAVAVAAGPRAAEVWSNALLRAALAVDERALARLGRAALPAVPGPVRRPSGVPPKVRRANVAHLRRGLAGVPLPRRCGRLVLRLAHDAMAAYARRLPGISQSSFRYLWDNLLAAEAAVRTEANAIDMRLAPPPLDVIWRLSGADRADYELPDGRRMRVQVRR